MILLSLLTVFSLLTLNLSNNPKTCDIYSIYAKNIARDKYDDLCYGNTTHLQHQKLR